ncbi:SLC13 family permease [Clostridium sp. C2-6-12]|uniref:SLC13 family permease n=1 Tax=Clostridium sp. C2-6-12 TaxID=2698832 RepID=UPI0013700E18|nr:SLC13 family permease [Clostridium sp. C2-6-12]
MKIKQFWNNTVIILKTEMVFTISLFLALTTSIITRPKLEYIDFQVLILLINLMIVICAFEKLKLLDKIAIKILAKNKSLRGISFVLVGLCFIFSMFITNDVALITFVPLTLIVANKAEFDPIKIIILETLAANIGSSLTPMGNPQNLYLYSFFNIEAITFFKATIYFVLIGVLWLVMLNYRVSNETLKVDLDKIIIKNKNSVIIFCCLFLIILLSVFHLFDYRIAFAITIFVSFFIEREIFKQLDYILLLTFVFFFVAIGNLSSMDFINNIMSSLLKSSTSVYFSAIFFSQFISNVPSAILLSQFTGAWREVLLGVNIGGMGTIIASLASLISYKLYAKEYDGKKYLFKFIKYNFCSLVIFTTIFYVFLKV